MRKVAVSAAVLCAAACGRPQGPIRIGVAGPFSESRGVSFRQSTELAAREINGRGGVEGRPIELVFRDDSARDAVAARIAQEFAADRTIVAVVGHLTSAATIAAVREYASTPKPVVLVSPSASSPDLSGISPFFFRVCPSDLTYGPRLARYARQELGARTAGLIYIHDDYGRGMRRSFAAEFDRIGGLLASDDPALPTTATVEPYLSRLRRSTPDILVLATDAEVAERALRDMVRLGVRWPVIGGDALVGIQRLGAAAEGLRITAAYLPDAPGPKNQAFVTAYAVAFPGMLPDHRGAGAYDIVHLLARAVAEEGASRRAIRDYLASVGTTRPAYEGVTGSIAFDAKGDAGTRGAIIGVVRNGRLITEWRE